MLTLLKCRSNLINPLLKTFSTEVNRKLVEEKWDLLAGVCVERLPIVTRDYNPLEEKISRLFSQIEYENSHKSKFEIRMEADIRTAKDLKEGKLDDTEVDKVTQTAQDFLDACNEELKAFKFNSRKMDAKIENDLKSTKRALDRRLLLIVQEKIGEQNQWILPHGKYNDEPSLRLTAERVLREKCGANINARFLGNCPWGFYKYKYPKRIRNDVVGAKIFFFKAQLIKGQVDEKICPEFHWATRRELTVLNKDYYKTISKFLIDEEH